MLIHKYHKEYQIENPKATLNELKTSKVYQKEFCKWFMRDKVEPLIIN